MDRRSDQARAIRGSLARVRLPRRLRHPVARRAPSRRPHRRRHEPSPPGRSLRRAVLAAARYGSTLTRRQRRAQLLARLFAAPALLRGEGAVLMVRCVELAFVGARTTRGQARLEGVELRRRMGIRLAPDNAHEGAACVRAVEAETDAVDQFADVRLGDTRVRADGAGRRASPALVEAPREHGGIGDQRPRVGSEDLLDAHGLPHGRWEPGTRDALKPRLAFEQPRHRGRSTRARRARRPANRLRMMARRDMQQRRCLVDRE